MPSRCVALPDELIAWLTRELDDPGPFEAFRLGGGNSNETLLLESPQARRVLRHPPPASLSPSAQAMGREHRVMAAVVDRGVPAPRPLALHDDPAMPGAPWLVMEHVDGVQLTDRLPEDWQGRERVVEEIGHAAIDALAALHSVDWRAAGLDGFGRPGGFLRRQVPRWGRQLETYRVRELPLFDLVGAWLEDNMPPAQEPALMHGDFRLDNTLIAERDGRLRVAAIIDWEMTTVGDPLMDLGLFLAFWGDDRPDPPAMPQLQGVSRGVPDAPTRAELARRYADLTGRSVDQINWYMAMALWKLAAIVESAYAHFVRGRLDSAYARALEHNVPRLLVEAARHCGIDDPAVEKGTTG